MHLPFYPAIPFARFWITDALTHVCPQSGTRRFTAALFVRAKTLEIA